MTQKGAGGCIAELHCPGGAGGQRDRAGELGEARSVEMSLFQVLVYI